jgi:hypothetical protein
MTKRYVSRFLALLFVSIAALTAAQAQRKVPTAEQILNINGAQGTEFWIAIPPNEINPFPVDELEIYVASAFETEIEVFDAAGAKTYKRKIQPYEIRTLSDKRGETNWTWECREPEQVVKKAVRITAKKPISVYVLNSKVTSSDGYMAIPVNGWGTEYLATTYFDFREFKPWACGFIVIGRENGTEVTIQLRGTGELDGKTEGGRRLNSAPFTILLDEGDVYMVKGDGETRGTFDLTGSKIKASKPVGMISFHERSTMPNLLINGNGRNHLAEMTPPSTTWGKRYVSVELQRENRNGQGKGDVFRVVAREPNTKWNLKYYDKQSKKLIGQGGGVLNKAGEFADITQAGAPTTITHGYSVWEADKPIFVMQYSCSSSWDGDPILDPFMINVTPEEQFITSTIFQFPTSAKFSKHRLNLIVKTDTSSPDLIKNLESLEIDGIPVWRHPSAQSPTLKFNKMSNGLYWTTLDFGIESRAHRITSNGTVSFGGYIYGYGAVDAYGWPAAAGFKPTTSVDTMAPLIIGKDVCGDYAFEATELRNIPDPPKPVPIDTDQVESGIAIIDTVEGANSFNYRLELVTDQIFPREPAYKKFKYEWKVIDKAKDARCIYFVQDFWGNVTIDTCEYYADKIAFSPTPLNFGQIRLNTSATADVTITNNSDAEVTLTNAKMQLGTYFSIAAGAIPPVVKIPAKGKHVLTIKYNGTRETQDVRTDFDKDSLVVNTTCGEFKHPIQGVAALPCITVEDFDAGTLSLNQQFCKAGGLRIANNGSDTLEITSITGFLGTDFTLTPPPALPIRILPKGFLELKELCYKSATIKVDDINVTFASNAGCGDSVSNWKGSTQSPGPIIIGKDWRERRVGTLHQGFGSVSNTGNQVLKLRDVTFMDGSKFFPAGSNDANYVFKIVGLIDGGNPVTTVDLSNGKSVDILVLFRPAGEATYSADIKPVWEGTIEERTAKLQGVGIIPKIDTDPIDLTCAETQEGVVAERDFTITNVGTMELTITGATLSAPVPPGFTIVSTTPALPMVVARNGGKATVRVSYTRPTGQLLAASTTLELVHDATPGTGADSSTLVPVGAHKETFSVGGCSGPDIETSDRDFGRQRANCDSPTLSFTVTNTGGGFKPLEVKALTPGGNDPTAFTIVGYLDDAGKQTTLPLVIPAGRTFQVLVKFTPTLPDAAPWADRNYSAQFEMVGFPLGETTPIKTVVAKLVGVGYVTPVTMDLGNNIAAGGSAEPGTVVDFVVSGRSGNWTSADLTSFIADVIVDKNNLTFNNGSVRIAGGLTGGWTVGDPVVSDINATQAQWRFTATGGDRIAGDGPLFTFKGTLLLDATTSSKQDLVLTLPRPCVIPSTTGDSTSIFNCALTRRVTKIGATLPKLNPVAPNPVTNGSATVSFSVGIPSMTTVELVDAQGVVVRTFVSGRLKDGEYDMSFTTAGMPSGIYFLRMATGAYSSSEKLIIVE